MRYLWTEDTGAGLHFWKLVNQLFLNNELVVESKGSNQGLLDAVLDLQYIAGFKRYSTERVMKSLVGEFTQNEKWSVKGALMGECWYKDCCMSEHTDSLRCGQPEVKGGDEKMIMLIQSEKVQDVIGKLIHQSSITECIRWTRIKSVTIWTDYGNLAAFKEKGITNRGCIASDGHWNHWVLSEHSWTWCIEV